MVSGSPAFSKSSLNIWKFMVHILLKPGLENFEHYFASMWDECHCAIDWIFFGIAFGIAWIMEYYSAMKDRKCWYMLQHGWTWKTWCEVKEAIHKRPYVLWFQFYIFKVQNRHIHRDKKKFVVAELGEGECREWLPVGMEFLWGVIKKYSGIR